MQLRDELVLAEVLGRSDMDLLELRFLGMRWSKLESIEIEKTD